MDNDAALPWSFGQLPTGTGFLILYAAAPCDIIHAGLGKVRKSVPISCGIPKCVS